MNTPFLASAVKASFKAKRQAHSLLFSESVCEKKMSELETKPKFNDQVFRDGLFGEEKKTPGIDFEQ